MMPNRFQSSDGDGAQAAVFMSKMATRLRHGNRHWAWRDVGYPFVLTRLALVLVGWFAQYLPANNQYPLSIVLERGWNYVPQRWLDIWGRWDTGWYLNIALKGYLTAAQDLAQESNIAFFPLYPYLIRLILRLVPAEARTWALGMGSGVILSNVMLVLALLLLHRLVLAMMNDRDMARRSVLYLLLFPTGFILSSAYSESAFLLFSVAALFAANRRLWMLAGLLGGLAALSRPLGIVILVPLMWLYLDSIGWRLQRVRGDVLWLALIPLALGLHLANSYRLTNDFLAPLLVQQAWNREFTWPWTTLLAPQMFNDFLTPIEQVTTYLFLFVALTALWRLPSPSYGIFALLLILPPLFTGTLTSIMRYYVVIFPVFVVLAQMGKRRLVDQAITVIFWTLQVMFMAAWSQFYWVA